MQKNCKKCNANFEITDDDIKFYDKISPIFSGKKYQIPIPTFCPECRQQRRLSFRNERKLYKRKCDLTGKDIISVFSPDKPFKVYEQKIWWSDQWNPLDYIQEYNFNISFSQQFSRLLENVPRMSMFNIGENIAYCSYCGDFKDSYMCVSGMESEKCCHCFFSNYSYNCFDCANIHYCQYCYECIDSDKLYECMFTQDSENSKNLIFCKNCNSCEHCLFCVGLVQKKYHINNKPYSKEEYFNALEKYKELIQKNIEELGNKLNKQSEVSSFKYYHGYNNEDIIADYITESKNGFYCFDVHQLEDSAYIFNSPRKAFSCYDSIYVVDSELNYECISSIRQNSHISTMYCWDSNNIFYSDHCFSCSDCFGCIGLRHKKYCILNKQYTKEEYEELAPKIIEYMQNTGEWGEFFPSGLSPFGYNETVANEYYPLTKEEALKKGFKWSDYESPIPKVDKIIPASKLPDDIKDIPDDILNWAIRCEVTNKPYKIIPQELKFYRDHNLPIPRRHPDQRHKDRMSLRNPRKLWSRSCDKCTKEIQTTYSPERPEKILCEECYLKEVY